MPVSIDRDRICVVLVSTRNPLNIGAVARAMCNFGFSQLRVVNPYDPAFRAARSAVGAAELLADAKEFTSVAAAVSDCTLVVGTTAVGRRLPQHPWHSLAAGAPWIREATCLDKTDSTAQNTHNIAILFGSEKFGLSNDDLSHCHWVMHVPTEAEQPSMNLGQAVAVCLYELVRGDSKTSSVEKPLAASAGDLERTTATLLDALRISGYIGAQASEEKESSVRRMIRRLNLSSEDATLWLGMLRQILWKLRTRD